MNDVQRQAWWNMFGMFLAVVASIIAIIVIGWLWLGLWRKICEVIGTPVPNFDGTVLSILSVIVFWGGYVGLKKWHQHEVERIAEKMNDQFDKL